VGQTHENCRKIGLDNRWTAGLNELQSIRNSEIRPFFNIFFQYADTAGKKMLDISMDFSMWKKLINSMFFPTLLRGTYEL